MTATSTRARDLIGAATRRNCQARLWLAVLDQDQHWVPRGAWDAYSRASIRTVALIPVISAADVDPEGIPEVHTDVRPDFTAPGIVALADIDDAWRTNLLGFLWARSAGICTGLADSAWTLLGAPDEVVAEASTEDLAWLHLARDEAARRAWFDQLPLVRALDP